MIRDKLGLGIESARERLNQYFLQILQGESDTFIFNTTVQDWFLIKRELLIYQSKLPNLEWRENELKRAEAEVQKIRIKAEEFKTLNLMFKDALNTIKDITDEETRNSFIEKIIEELGDNK